MLFRSKKLGEFVVKRPISVLLVSLFMLAIPASQLVKLQVTPSSISAIPSNLESAEAIKIVTDKAGEGIISPIQVLIKLPEVADVNIARATLAGEIANNKDVFAVATDRSYVDKSGKVLRIFVISKKDLGSSQQLINYLRTLKGEFPAGTEILIGGAPAQGADLVAKLKGTFPWIALIALLFSFALLDRKSTRLNSSHT